LSFQFALTTARAELPQLLLAHLTGCHRFSSVVSTILITTVFKITRGVQKPALNFYFHF